MDLCRFHSVLALALALLAPAAAQGPVVHEQLPLVGPTGAYTLAGQPPSVQRGADNFLVPATGMTLGVVEFWGIYDVWLSGPSFPLPTAPDFFDLRIFPDFGGLPAATPLIEYNFVQVERTATPHTLSPFHVPIWTFRIDLPTPITLSQGTYWLEVQAMQVGQTAYVSGFGWSWSNQRGPTSVYGDAYSSGAGVWIPFTTELAFRLSEPGPRRFELSALGSCPGPMAARVDGGRPDGPVAILAGTQPGFWTQLGGRCAGTSAGVEATVLRLARLDAMGSLAFTLNMPAAACGQVHLQAVDLTTCALTGVLAL